MALQTVVDTATLVSLVNALSQLTVVLQAQLAQAGQAAPSSGPANIPVAAAPTASAAATPSTGSGVVTNSAGSTGIPPEQVAHNISTVSASSWYVVTQGRTTGVYTTVFEANSNILGISGATMSRVGSKTEALAHYSQAWDSGNVHTI